MKNTVDDYVNNWNDKMNNRVILKNKYKSKHQTSKTIKTECESNDRFDFHGNPHGLS